MYELLDIAFLIFHSGLILFNLFGWIWEVTRRWNLATLLLTAFSWFGLGIFYGWGYCPCTHWHWLVRRELGDYSMPDSYIQFLIREVTGLQLKAELVDVATFIFLFTALTISLYVNVRDFEK
jgi:hypothetical protein